MAQSARKTKKLAYEDLTEESIRCRVNNHRWMPYNAARVVGAFETDEVCERCKSHRVSVISNRGEVRSRSIRYADGYLHEGGRLEVSDRNGMRLTLLQWDFKQYGLKL